MTSKPTTLAGYGDDDLGRVRSACLYVATTLGDMLDDIVVVGGLAPSLLVNQGKPPPGIDAHAGTKDLDLGLALTILEEDRYRELSTRLRDAGLLPDVNAHGNPTNQRWRVQRTQNITVDFLIAPSLSRDSGGTLRHIQRGFAAVITPGLHLAFTDRLKVQLSGRTTAGEAAVRDIWVCGPGAFLVLKALAFRNRGANKDAYDLTYVLRGIGIEKTADSLRRLAGDSFVEDALAIIRQDFTSHDGLGPRRVAQFLTTRPDDNIQADVVGDVLAFLEEFTKR